MKMIRKTRHACLAVSLLLFTLSGLGCGGRSEQEATDVYIQELIDALNQTIAAREAMRDTSGKTKAQVVDAARVYRRHLTALPGLIDNLDTAGVYPQAVGLGESIADWSVQMEKLVKAEPPMVTRNTGLERFGRGRSGNQEGELIEALFDEVIRQESEMRTAHDYTNDLLSGFCDQIIEHRARRERALEAEQPVGGSPDALLGLVEKLPSTG